jgi:hypothetical protein
MASTAARIGARSGAASQSAVDCHGYSVSLASASNGAASRSSTHRSASERVG